MKIKTNVRREGYIAFISALHSAGIVAILLGLVQIAFAAGNFFMNPDANALGNFNTSVLMTIAGMFWFGFYALDYASKKSKQYTRGNGK